MKMTWWKALGLVGLLADELTRAGEDNKISFEESLVIAKNLATASGLVFDDKGAAMVVETVTDIVNASADGKITISEMVALTEKMCVALGIEFDKTGVNI